MSHETSRTAGTDKARETLRDAAHTALLVIGVQNEFCHEVGYAQRPETILSRPFARWANA